VEKIKTTKAKKENFEHRLITGKTSERKVDYFKRIKSSTADGIHL
jgi:hypothetical protein